MEGEEMTATEEPRIGVFVCHCGSNIGGVVNVPSVAEYAKTLPGVVYATDNLYTCAEDGLASIEGAVKEHNLNRVVVASCTPRTHAPLFQATVEKAGLNKYLFTFVNIREHCSWVHMTDKEGATEKAMDLIRMGVARAALLTPQEEPRIPVEKSALVIGGGVAGMRAALSLAIQGFPVHLVEKEAELGGFVRNLNNLYVTKRDAMETIKPLIVKVSSHPNIMIHLNSKLNDVYGYIGNFEVAIDTNGQETKAKVGTIIVATGAIEYSKEGLYGYNVYENVVTLTEFEMMCKNKTLPKIKSVAFIQCAGSRGQDKSYCSRICCNVAIKNAINIVDNYDNMLGLAEELGTAIHEVPVEEKAPEQVMERRRRRRGRERGGEEEEGVAAEERRIGVGPRIDVTVFNRDIMSYGVDHELLYNKAREKRVRFVRYTADRRPEVFMDGDQLKLRYFHETLKVEREMPVDIVILSTPLIAPANAEELSKMLKVPIGQDGFFLEAHVKLRPVDFATDGVFVAGTAKGPADITEAIDQAEAAASRAATPLWKGYVQAEAIMAKVDEDVCSGCGTCIEICPYSAVSKNDKGLAEVVAAACKGCGCCCASCPENAISMANYSDDQLLAEAVAALREVV